MSGAGSSAVARRSEAPMRAADKATITTTIFIPVLARRLYSIDFNEAICQDAIRVAKQMDADHHRAARGGGAFDRDRAAVHRPLELAPKRCGGDRAELSRKRFSLRSSANRLGRQCARIRGHGISNSAVRCGALL